MARAIAAPWNGDEREGSRGWNAACVSCGQSEDDAVHRLNAPCLGCGITHHVFEPFELDAATLEERTRPLDAPSVRLESLRDSDTPTLAQEARATLFVARGSWRS